MYIIIVARSVTNSILFKKYGKTFNNLFCSQISKILIVTLYVMYNFKHTIIYVSINIMWRFSLIDLIIFQIM